MPNVPQARFAVIELGEHPEWRQFLALNADQRANELNRLRELLDIKGANDVASTIPMVAAQHAVDTGASTPAQVPIATPDENHAVRIQEDKLAVPTLPDDTRASVEEEKPTVSAREEKPIVADQRANELNRLHEPLDIKGANNVASDIPKGVAQPTNRSDSDQHDSDVLSMQSPAADTGASTPAQLPIATPDENHVVGVQENKLGVPALPDDTRTSVEEEKPTVSAREEKPIAADQRANELDRSHELLDIKGANDVASDTPVVAPQPANRNDSDLVESNVLNMSSQAADTGASFPVQVAAPDENHATGIQEEKRAVPTLPEDTRASVQEEKPTVSALEDKRVAIGSEKSTKVTPGKKSAAIKTPQRVRPRGQSPAKAFRNARSRARAPLKQKPSSPQYFFDPFGYQQSSQTSMVNATNQQTRQISTPNANNYIGNQRAGQPEMPNVSNH
jgi:hypothetical protein